MLRESGSTRVMAGPSGSGGTGESVLRAVLATVSGQYQLLGELGRAVAGTIMYLARELYSSQLVVLRLDPAQGGEGFVLSVMRELNASIPGGTAPCPECGATAVVWGRFCPACGADLAGEEGVAASASSLDGRAEAARQPAPDGYDILGSIPRAGGASAGVVYFARELATGSLVALTARTGGSSGREAGVGGFHILQTLRPITSADPPAAPTWTTGLSPVEPVPAAPPRAQPTAQRGAPQEVLIPADELSSPDDRLPPRQVGRSRHWWIAPAALSVAAVIGLAAFVKTRASQPDGTDSRLGSGGMGIPLASAAPTGTARIDSGYIRVAGALPHDAIVTIDGKATADETVALAPGEHLLAASAPGHVRVSERLKLEPGQTLVWMPTLAPTPTSAGKAPARSSSSAAASSARKAAAADAPRDSPLVAGAATPAPSCQSAFDANDWRLAATLCAAEAREGSVAAQRNLGVMYDRGVGVPRDPAQAADWLRRAAEAGNRDAAYQLGAMYENGRGVAEDDARAVAWYSKAALLGDREAQVKVGKAYEQGLGVASDMGEALTWYRKAAGQGDAWAQNYIGFLYGNGKGMRHDDAEALRWFRQAAANGNAQAEYNVGFMYANGRGVARSETEAVRWYKLAASHGYAEAAKELERRGIKP
jgi:TPR repeat protein